MLDSLNSRVVFFSVDYAELSDLPWWPTGIEQDAMWNKQNFSAENCCPHSSDGQ